MSIAVRLPEHTAGARRRFISDLRAVAGTGARALYMPSGGEGTTTVDAAVSTRVWTHGTAVANRITRLGKGFALSFNGTTDYISAPDAADITFGTGAADTVFSGFVVANVTDSAAARVFFSKSNTGEGEYIYQVGATDLSLAFLQDNSAAVNAFRQADAAITQGSWTTHGFSYDATGGATAANGIVIYQNGAAFASTATNNAGYVSMEDKAAVLEIGSSTAHTLSFFLGSIALVLIVAANLSAAQQFQLNQLSKRFYGI